VKGEKGDPEWQHERGKARVSKKSGPLNALRKDAFVYRGRGECPCLHRKNMRKATSVDAKGRTLLLQLMGALEKGRRAGRGKQSRCTWKREGDSVICGNYVLRRGKHLFRWKRERPRARANADSSVSRLENGGDRRHPEGNKGLT